MLGLAFDAEEWREVEILSVEHIWAGAIEATAWG